MKDQVKITHEDLTAQLEHVTDFPLNQQHWRAIQHAQAAKAGSVTERNRWRAAGRNVFAAQLIAAFGLKRDNFGALTKAIRAGHAEEPNWNDWNDQAGALLRAHLSQ